MLINRTGTATIETGDSIYLLQNNQHDEAGYGILEEVMARAVGC